MLTIKIGQNRQNQTLSFFFNLGTIRYSQIYSLFTTLVTFSSIINFLTLTLHYNNNYILILYTHLK